MADDHFPAHHLSGGIELGDGTNTTDGITFSGAVSSDADSRRIKQTLFGDEAQLEQLTEKK